MPGYSLKYSRRAARTAFLAFFFLIAGRAFADNSKISPDLRANKTSSGQVQVIVQYAPGTQVSCNGLLGLVGGLLNDVVKLGGSILGQLPLINGVVALLDGPGIVSLSNQSNVVYISPDRPLIPLDANANGAINAQFASQSNYTGTGIGVALIDSGVNSHVDLFTGILPLPRVVSNQSFLPGNSNAADQYGHGTHIAGLIAGDGLAVAVAVERERPRACVPGRIAPTAPQQPEAARDRHVRRQSQLRSHA